MPDLGPSKLPILEKQIWELTQEAELNRDLGIYDQPQDFGGFILEIDGYLCELKDAQIKDGLHTLGETPQGEQLVGLLSNLTRLQNSNQIPSLRASIAEALGLDYGDLIENPGAPLSGSLSPVLARIDAETPARVQGDLLERLETLARRAFEMLLARGFRPEQVPEVVSQLLGRPTLQPRQSSLSPLRRSTRLCSRRRMKYPTFSRGWKAALFRRAPAARRPAGWPTSCPLAGTFTP